MTTERTVERTNEEWLVELRGKPPLQTQALNDLRMRLQRSILYYLSQERSDLRDLSTQELEQMAEDLSQDALMRIMANLDTFRGESLFTTWANRIAIRLAISDLRRARYKDFSLDNLTAEGEILPVTSAAAPSVPNPEASTERNDVLEIITRAFDEALTERQFRALEAVALKGIPMDVVAEQMGTNRNALYKLLHDARRKLRAYLETQEISTEYIMTLFQ